MLAIFLHIDNTTESLLNLISNIPTNSAKNITLYIHDSSSDEKKLFNAKKYDFSQFKNIQYITANNVKNSLGYAYNDFLATTKEKYAYFMNSYSALPVDFFDTLNNENKDWDFAIANSLVNETRSCEKIKNLFPCFLPILYDKIFSVDFLKSKGITFSLNHPNILVFLYKVLKSFSKAYLIKTANDIKKCFFLPYTTPNHNLELLNEFTSNYERSNFWNDNFKQISFLASFYVIGEVLPCIFASHKNVIVRENAVMYCETYLNKHFKNWSDNSIYSANNLYIFKLIKRFNFSDKAIEEINQNII